MIKKILTAIAVVVVIVVISAITAISSANANDDDDTPTLRPIPKFDVLPPTSCSNSDNPNGRKCLEHNRNLAELSRRRAKIQVTELLNTRDITLAEIVKNWTKLIYDEYRPEIDRLNKIVQNQNKIVADYNRRIKELPPPTTTTLAVVESDEQKIQKIVNRIIPFKYSGGRNRIDTAITISELKTRCNPKYRSNGNRPLLEYADDYDFVIVTNDLLVNRPLLTNAKIRWCDVVPKNGNNNLALDNTTDGNPYNVGPDNTAIGFDHADFYDDNGRRIDYNFPLNTRPIWPSGKRTSTSS